MPVLFNKDKVAVGVATLYLAPADTEMPPVSQAYETPWPEPWTPGGGTSEGVSISVEPDTSEITIEESPTPALILGNTLNLTIESDLAEDTMQTMKYAYGAGGTLTTHAATETLPGYEELTLSADLGILAVGVEMKVRRVATDPASPTFWRRYYIPRMTSAGTSETSYRRTENARTYPISLSSISEPSEVRIIEMTAPALGVTP